MKIKDTKDMKVFGV